MGSGLALKRSELAEVNCFATCHPERSRRIQSIVMPAAERASPFYIGTNEFFVYSVIAVYKVREFPRCQIKKKKALMQKRIHLDIRL